MREKRLIESREDLVVQAGYLKLRIFMTPKQTDINRHGQIYIVCTLTHTHTHATTTATIPSVLPSQLFAILLVHVEGGGPLYVPSVSVREVLMGEEEGKNKWIGLSLVTTREEEENVHIVWGET